MSQSEPASSGGRDRRYVVTTGVVERPVAERPTKDSPDAIAEWLVGAAREIPEGLQAFDEFAWRMHGLSDFSSRIAVSVRVRQPSVSRAARVRYSASRVMP